MFDLGDYPGLIEHDPGSQIDGEVYQVDESIMKQLDIVEGVAEGYYRRGQIALGSPWEDKDVVTYFYLKPVTGFPVIAHWPPENGGS